MAQRAMFHLANSGGRVGTIRLTLDSTKQPEYGAVGHPRSERPPNGPGVWTQKHAVKCSFQLLVFMNISMRVPGISTCICDSTSMPVRQLMGKTSPSLKRLPTFWAHLVLESTAAVIEL